jgi:hypothetical protein
LRAAVFLRVLVFLRAEVLRFGAFLMAIGSLPSPFRVRGQPSDARGTGGVPPALVASLIPLMLERAQVLRGDARADVGERTLCAPALAAPAPRISHAASSAFRPAARTGASACARRNQHAPRRVDDAVCDVAIAAPTWCARSDARRSRRTMCRRCGRRSGARALRGAVIAGRKPTGTLTAVLMGSGMKLQLVRTYEGTFFQTVQPGGP